MRALVVGRFQPFHIGHLRMLEYVAGKVDLVVVCIGSSNKSHTLDNPFTAQERMEMIKNSVPFKNYAFASIPDVGDDQRWAESITDSLEFDVVYTNSGNEQRIFRQAGVKVEDVPFFEREKYSAVEVREKMVEGEDWESLLPDGTLKVLKEINGAERVRKLNEA